MPRNKLKLFNLRVMLLLENFTFYINALRYVRDSINTGQLPLNVYNAAGPDNFSTTF